MLASMLGQAYHHRTHGHRNLGLGPANDPDGLGPAAPESAPSPSPSHLPMDAGAVCRGQRGRADGRLVRGAQGGRRDETQSQHVVPQPLWPLFFVRLQKLGAGTG